MSSTTSHKQLRLMCPSTVSYHQPHYNGRLYQQGSTSPVVWTGHASNHATSSPSTSTPSTTWSNSPPLGDMHAYREEQLFWDDDSMPEYLDLTTSTSHGNQVSSPSGCESTAWSTIYSSTTSYSQPDQSPPVEFDVSSLYGAKSRSQQAIDKRKSQNRKAQRAYRARREAQVKKLIDDLNALLQRCDQDRMEQERLRRCLAKLQRENEELKRLLRSG
ncbi:hypothetical protein AYO21_03006 [Fonsecaea monophora]|uniref:BZIP domain-containing protein n=1 Tax=Fonsecaea monophora TaxID=254056 RepID=A0A177FEQ1_9EURO|nr:hypothetical protein AYO21_03006 [Fonsecaea monophora]KAH0841989.1 hypothetical protein FOPE_07057 [Fonsecaea pedrosoi]OAG42723.1 hypothetical protein AYO21_03006 [Fonsecaea monophora]